MKIVVVETHICHCETMGYFFDLKCRNPDIEIVLYVANKMDSWLRFFNDRICNLDIRDIKNLHDEPIVADVLFVNTIDIYGPNIDQKLKSFDHDIERYSNFHKFDKKFLQLHCGTNIVADRYNNPEFKIVSPFPNPDTIYQIMPYSIDSKSRKISNPSDRVRLAVVGVIERSNSNTIRALAIDFDITHYHRKRGGDRKLNNVKYVTDAPTELFTDSLLNDIDYILVDYNHTDRMSGIIIQAFCLEIPFIVREDYAKVLGLPLDICVTFNEVDDIKNNKNLRDTEFYKNMVNNIKKYRETLIRETDMMLGL